MISLDDSEESLLACFLNKAKLSENFFDFVCKCLNHKTNVSVIANHNWIKVNNYIHLNNNLTRVRVSIKELMRIFQANRSQGEEKRRPSFFKSIKMILDKHGLKLESFLIDKRNVMKEISYELGYETEKFIKLMNEAR